MNHVYDRDRDSVVFPTNERTKLHAALNWPWVSFEILGLEPGGSGGWSVLVVGRAEEVTEPGEIARAAEQRHVAWRAGRNVRWIRIVPATVTGRRISATATR